MELWVYPSMPTIQEGSNYSETWFWKGLRHSWASGYPDNYGAPRISLEVVGMDKVHPGHRLFSYPTQWCAWKILQVQKRCSAGRPPLSTSLFACCRASLNLDKWGSIHKPPSCPLATAIWRLPNCAICRWYPSDHASWCQATLFPKISAESFCWVHWPACQLQKVTNASSRCLSRKNGPLSTNLWLLNWNPAFHLPWTAYGHH